MKRTYIKPEMELLDSEFSTILCNSSYNWNVKDGPSGGQGQPTPDGARTEDPFFDDEEEF